MGCLAPKLRGMLIMAIVMIGLLDAGCIIPTQLHTIPAEVNAPPAILESLSEPRFGPLFVTGFVEFKVAVDDPNVGDDLKARLFLLEESGQPTYTLIERQPTIDPDVETRRRFNFGVIDVCTLYGNSTLAVVVADRPFLTAPGSESLSEGLTDENAWTLRCN